MVPMADLLVHVYVLVADALAWGRRRAPAPRPAAGVLGRGGADARGRAPPAGPPQRAGLPDRGAPRLGHVFPVLPAQSECNRRVRWLWGAFELLRAGGRCGACRRTCGEQVDATAVPVKHPSRVRGPDCPGRAGRAARPASASRRGAPGVVLRLPAGAAHRPGPWVVRLRWLEWAAAGALLEGAAPAGLPLGRGSSATLGGGAPVAGHPVLPRARPAGGRPAPVPPGGVGDHGRPRGRPGATAPRRCGGCSPGPATILAHTLLRLASCGRAPTSRA